MSSDKGNYKFNLNMKIETRMYSLCLEFKFSWQNNWKMFSRKQKIEEHLSQIFSFNLVGWNVNRWHWLGSLGFSPAFCDWRVEYFHTFYESEILRTSLKVISHKIQIIFTRVCNLIKYHPFRSALLSMTFLLVCFTSSAIECNMVSQNRYKNLIRRNLSFLLKLS